MYDEQIQIPFGKKSSWLSAAIVLAVGLAVGFALGAKGFLASRIPPNIIKALADSVEQPEGVDFFPVWKAWRTIDEKFVPAAVGTSTPIATTTEAINEKKLRTPIGRPTVLSSPP